MLGDEQTTSGAGRRLSPAWGCMFGSVDTPKGLDDVHMSVRSPESLL